MCKVFVLLDELKRISSFADQINGDDIVSLVLLSLWMFTVFDWPNLDRNLGLNDD